MRADGTLDKFAAKYFSSQFTLTYDDIAPAATAVPATTEVPPTVEVVPAATAVPPTAVPATEVPLPVEPTQVVDEHAANQ